MYSLNADYYFKKFDTIDELIEDVVVSGINPSVEITKDGKGIGEFPIDYMTKFIKTWSNIQSFFM